MPKSNQNQPVISSWTFVFLLGGVIALLALLQLPFRGRAVPFPIVAISEFCAHNASGLRDEDGDHSDWIELHNLGTTATSLDGWYLTDNFRLLRKWRFPDIQIKPGEFLIVFASGKDRREP